MNAETVRAEYQTQGSYRATGRKLGISETTVRRVVNGLREVDFSRIRQAPLPLQLGTCTLTTPTMPAHHPHKTLADFKATYDKATIIPAKIRAEITALTPERWEYESQFAKSAGVSLSDLGDYRDQFSEYVVALERGTRRAWAGSTQLAATMREML